MMLDRGKELVKQRRHKSDVCFMKTVNIIAYILTAMAVLPFLAFAVVMALYVIVGQGV